MDMSDKDWGQDRFTDVTDQMNQGNYAFFYLVTLISTYRINNNSG